MIAEMKRQMLAEIAKLKAAAAAAAAASGGSTIPGDLSHASGSLPANYKAIVTYLVAAWGSPRPRRRAVAGNIMIESGGNPNIWEAGGGGGYGLIQWTPPPPGWSVRAGRGTRQIVREGTGMFSGAARATLPQPPTST